MKHNNISPGALEKMAPSGGRREKFWGISCEKTRFYAKKPHILSNCGGRRENFGVFRVKKHDFTPKKNIFFPIAEGGAKNFGVFRDFTPKNHIFSNSSLDPPLFTQFI
jgi:hypothetical protein